MLESSSSDTPTLTEISSEAETLETAIAGLEETLRRPGLAGPERDKVVRELSGLQCELAQLRTAHRHAAIRKAMA